MNPRLSTLIAQLKLMLIALGIMKSMETESVPPVVSTPAAPASVSGIHIWALAVAVQEGAKKASTTLAT